MRSWLLMSAVLILPASVAADTPPRPQDFAFGYDIELTGKAAIYRLPLPQEVYLGSTRDDLSDLRVFDAAGEAVPHTLRRAASAKPGAGTSTPLPVFPLPAAETGSATGPLSVQVVRDPRGAVVRVDEGTNTADATPRIGAYLIDTSQLQRPPDALELAWATSGKNFVATVSLAGSDDLTTWHTLVGDAAVARLDFAGRVLERNRLELPARRYKYLRLNWPTAAGGTTLSTVTGHFHAPGAPARRAWVTLTGTPVDGEPATFEYHVDGRPRIDRVGLALPPGNTLVEATIASRDMDEPWRQRYRGAFYRLSVDGAELTNLDAAIPATQAAHWRVRVADQGAEGDVPPLRLGWELDDLYFLASGEGPYTLAYGAANVPQARTAVGGLLQRLGDRDAGRFIATARIGAARTLGGPSNLDPAPPPLPWQQILLWGVLVLGVAALGIMAWRLWRQLRDAAPR